MRQAEHVGRRGFTLIELLVTVAIIALLMSILLPSLGAARRVARQVVCGSNLRQLGTGMNGYTLDHKEWLPGSPTTSGSEAYFNKKYNGVAISGYDFLGPIAQSMGMRAPGEVADSSGLDERDRYAKYNWYRSAMKGAMCPENNVLSVPYPNKNDPLWAAGKMLSYNFSTQFSSNERPPAEGGTGNRVTSSGIDRRGYQPMLSKVGTASMKMFVFEGARYHELTAQDNQYPDFDVSIDGRYGGAFGGTGPWYFENRELSRLLAPGEALSYLLTAFDPRRWAFRHGNLARGNTSGRGGSGVQCVGQGVFFDTHVETMDDGEATNPDISFPTGTRLNVNNKRLETWNLTKTRWPDKTGSRGEYIVP